MAAVLLTRVLVAFFFFHSLLADETERHTRFEYKYSFKGPHLVNKQGNIPFWTYGGSAIPGDEQVRLTPSLRDKKGFMWTKNKFENEWWEIEAIFRVTGRGRVGADGLAIWYTEEQGIEGPVFGSSDKWNGLGILCDSFDNDGEQNNPFISVMVNDKTKSYDHHSDGSSQHQGGCLRDFRNRPHPVRVKVRYYNNILTTWFHSGMSTKPEDYEICTRVEDVNLPKSGYFGISAATGGLADDHDALAFLTHSILMKKVEEESEKKEKDAQQLSEEDQKKYSEQYEEYAQKLEKQKEEYAKQHPDKAKKPDQQYENGYDRDVRLVYEGQNVIHHMVNNLHNKVGELTVQINALQTLVSTDHARNSKLVSKDDTINRQEVNTLVNLQHQLANKLEGIRSQLEGGNMQKREISDDSQLNVLKSNLENVMHNVNHLVTQQQFVMDKAKKETECPPTPPMPQCIGPGYFVFLIVAQLVMIMGYIIYRNQKEQSAKKFF